MRFPQLPIGQGFSYRGRRYTKVGPLTACEDATGKQHLIMKSAEVTPLGFTASHREQKRQYSRREVTASLQRYRGELSAVIRDRAGSRSSLSLEEVLELIAAQPFPDD